MSNIAAIDFGPISWVKREQVTWVWPERIARGKVQVLDGDPGLGKSTITLDLAARVSTASPFPDGARLDWPGQVVLLNAEDGWGDTIRPRLEAAGANLERVHYLRGVQREGQSEMYPPEIPAGLDAVESAVAETEASLVIIDPLMAFLSSGTDSHRDHDIRRALAPLAALADRTGAAVLIVRHLNKASAGNPIYRGGGSIGIIGAARAAMMVGADPNDETQRVLAMTKSNLAPLAPSLSYRLVPDEEYGCARIAWAGVSAHSAADLLTVRDQDQRSAEDEAASFLKEELKDKPLPVAILHKAAKEAGISERTLDRAKAKLKVESVKLGTPGSQDQRWVWKLPDAEGCQPPEQRTLAPFEDAGTLRAGQGFEPFQVEPKALESAKSANSNGWTSSSSQLGGEP